MQSRLILIHTYAIVLRVRAPAPNMATALLVQKKYGWSPWRITHLTGHQRFLHQGAIWNPNPLAPLNPHYSEQSTPTSVTAFQVMIPPWEKASRLRTTSPEVVDSYCRTHGFTDPFRQDGYWWAFPPHGAMPIQLPIPAWTRE